MTEAQLMPFRRCLQVQVRDFALQQLVDGSRAIPNGPAVLQQWANKVRSYATYQTFPGADQELAQQVSSEYLEAIEEMLGKVGL
jgi:hypothetical protein